MNMGEKFIKGCCWQFYRCLSLCSPLQMRQSVRPSGLYTRIDTRLYEFPCGCIWTDTYSGACMGTDTSLRLNLFFFLFIFFLPLLLLMSPVPQAMFFRSSSTDSSHLILGFPCDLRRINFLLGFSSCILQRCPSHLNLRIVITLEAKFTGVNREVFWTSLIGTGIERVVEAHVNYIDQILVNVGLVPYE
jgi:hypothetical protein